jgi:cohesin loading factor subunit SCC2
LQQIFNLCFQNLRPPPSAEARHDLETGKTEYIYDEDLDDEFDSVFSRLPEHVGAISGAIITAQGCMLLLVLKEHLKDFYGLTARCVQLFPELIILISY